MRTSFEVKVYASTLEDAKTKAYQEISKFMGVSSNDVKSIVDLELKVKTYELKDDAPEPDGDFEVVVYGAVKHSIVKPL
jgi:hypothetical protein